MIRDADALGRLGVDEFVVLSEDISLAAGPALVAELLEALAHSFELGVQETRVTVTASIGIAGGERASAEELLAGGTRHAARDRRGQGVVVTRLDEPPEIRVSLLTHLRLGLCSE